MLLWNRGSFSLKQALRSNYLSFSELRSLKLRKIVTYSELSSPDKIFTLLPEWLLNFIFCLLLSLRKHMDFFFLSHALTKLKFMTILQFVLPFLIWHSLIFSQEACMYAAVFQFVLASLLHLLATTSI